MTIKNTGNVEIDITINESLYNGLMYCTTSGSDNITTDAGATGVKFNMTNGFSFADTVTYLNDSNYQLDFNLAEADQSGTPVAPVDDVYWRLVLPASELIGSCTTTVRIAAVTST